MYGKEAPKLNKEIVSAWKCLMKLHLGGLGDYAKSTITIKHVDWVGAPTIDQLKQIKEHNQAMLEISYALSYSEFDDIKECDTTKKMWDALQVIYGGGKKCAESQSWKPSRKIWWNEDERGWDYSIALCKDQRYC